MKMELRIKQRVFSWTDTYDVYDENGEPRYYVEAEFFTFGHQIHVYDKRSGQEVGSIHQKLFTFLPQFEIVIGGRTVGTICKEFSFFVPHYHVDFRGWDVDGDLMGWDYEARANGRTVLTVSKELFHWGDTYVLKYQNPADEIPGLLLVLAIDAVNCSKNK
ncbi:MAG: LURP-one-related family protein [Oscillospiraceae bacterium]|nr:LURP-one-related family protein [Oscillospiraceae bacterium]